MSAAIKIDNLSKKYLIRHEQQPHYVALRDVISTSTSRLFQAVKHILRRQDRKDVSCEEFWALKDVSLEIQPGERIGIIGRNGAGKSTLLKILSRITEPTTGRIRLEGRVASLLEVGTGFHPELTGRENIFLNGAILGMRKAEIIKNFDAIVDFAEVEKFLDTPVKRYSSGMYVRLAFSVAAHLESDILIVDEVLAVGDAGFQKKCMGKMESVASEGRTILFVSHNMGAITELCTRAVLLHKGHMVLDGATEPVIERYLADVKKAGDLRLEPDRDRPIFVTEVRLIDQEGASVSDIRLGQDATLEVKYTITSRLSNVAMAMLLSRLGNSLLYSYDTDLSQVLEESIREPGHYTAYIQLPLSRFKEGLYTVEVKIGVGQTNMTDERATMLFEITNYSVNATNKSYRVDRPGHLYWPLKWDTKKC
ncbi:MAG: ABC transporter ATP-binding protein [Nitrospira sp.]|jgi:lipopolysaccharide transport system ATP-binding protein|nr:ABC transporter ATP-binding protein [Nitrospira sp.]